MNTLQKLPNSAILLTFQDNIVWWFQPRTPSAYGQSKPFIVFYSTQYSVIEVGISSTCLQLVRKALDLYNELTRSMYRMNELAFEELEEFNSTFKGVKAPARRRWKEVEKKFDENEARFKDILSRAENVREKMAEYLAALRDAIAACVPPPEKEGFKPPHMLVLGYELPSDEKILWSQASEINKILEELSGKEGWLAPIIASMRDDEEVFEKARRGEKLDAYEDYLVLDNQYIGLSLDFGRTSPTVDYVYHMDKLAKKIVSELHPGKLLSYIYKKLSSG